MVHRAAPPTIFDVASRAQVSKSTVSRVLQGTGRYSDTTRLRVQQAAAELGFAANAMAQGLARRRTHTIGMLVRDGSSMLYTALHSVMARHAAASGYRVVTTVGDDDVTREKAALATLLSLRVDGLVVCSGLLPADDIAEFAGRVAVVVAGRPELHPSLSSVYCDEIRAGAELADAVVEKGHRTVGVLTVPRRDAMTQFARSSAMRDRLLSRGVDVIEVEASFARPPSAIADEVAVRTGEGMTAVMCPSDRALLDLGSALEQHGVRIPAHLSATGFDGAFPLASPWLGLTTYEQPVERMGREAVELVIAHIDEPARTPEHRALLGRLLPGRTLAVA